jgi:hypothetical protein
MARKMLLKEQTLPCTRHASKVKAQANACGGACKTFQPNDADHEHASGSSNANSLQRNEKANSKRRVSGRKNPANSEVLDIIGRSGETCQMEDNIDNKKLVSDSDNDAENHINDNVQSKRFIYSKRLDNVNIYLYFTILFLLLLFWVVFATDIVQEDRVAVLRLEKPAKQKPCKRWLTPKKLRGMQGFL